VAALGGELTGRVSVGSIQTAIRTVVAPMLVSLGERHPHIEVDVQEYDPAESNRRLRAGDLDAVVLERDVDVDAPAPRGAHDVPLLDEPWRIVVPTSLPEPERLDDLAALTWVGPQADSAAERAAGRLAAQLGTTFDTRHAYNDFDTAISLVAAGQGIAMLPALAMQQELPDGVAVVALAGLGSRRLVVRHRQNRHEPGPIVRAVVDEMVAAAREIDLG